MDVGDEGGQGPENLRAIAPAMRGVTAPRRAVQFMPAVRPTPAGSVRGHTAYITAV